MNCDELNARLISRKATLMRLQAVETAKHVGVGDHSGVYPEYLAAKAEYEKTSREYLAVVLGK